MPTEQIVKVKAKNDKLFKKLLDQKLVNIFINMRMTKNIHRHLIVDML